MGEKPIPEGEDESIFSDFQAHICNLVEGDLPSVRGQDSGSL